MSEYTEAVEAATTEARARFNAFRDAAVHDGPLPSDPHEALQVDLMRRARGRRRDFDGLALRLVQEVGEAFEARDGDPAVAALGRALVAAGELLIGQGMSLVPVVDLVPLTRNPNVGPSCSPAGALGYLARACTPIGARDLAWRRNLVAGVAAALAAATDTVEINSSGGEAIDLLEVYRIVATEILLPLPPHRTVPEILRDHGIDPTVEGGTPPRTP
jgi:hypothetical protein